MQETTEQQKQIAPPPPEKLSTTTFMLDVLQGLGVMLGLALLWLFETMRDVIFRALDRMNIKARGPRRVSAFPPGTPKQRAG